jgi:ketosteroid isomerase-like protein
VELARRALDAFNRRDLGAYLELMDADVEFVAGGTMEGD